MAFETIDFRFAYSFAETVVELVRGESERAEDERSYYLPTEDRDAFVARAAVPSRHTLLHDYIHHAVVEGYEYDIYHCGAEHLPGFAPLLTAAAVGVPDWLNEDEARPPRRSR